MTAYLLDTHTYLWWLGNDSALPVLSRKIIQEGRSIAVSLVTAWEIAIKANIGKLRDEGDFEQLTQDNEFTILPIRLEHIALIKTLPLHHRDPFDRMLIAQAMVENMTLISGDGVFDAYGVRRVWAPSRRPVGSASAPAV